MAASQARIDEIRRQRAAQGLPSRLESKETIKMITKALIASQKRGAAA